MPRRTQGRSVPHVPVADGFLDSIDSLPPEEIERLTTEMGVGSIGPIVDRAYKDANNAYQHNRELPRNALEADATKITIEPDWRFVETTAAVGTPVYRYLIADNGCGMTGDELVRFFNRISSSGKIIGTDDLNFGMGAKISLLPWNHYGIVIMSWKDGVGAMIRIRRYKDTYVLHVFEVEVTDPETGDTDIQLEKFIEPDIAYKKQYIGTSEHGTIVIATGMTGTEDTYLGAPVGARRRENIISIENRFFEIPDGVDFQVYEFDAESKDKWPKSRAQATKPGFGQYRGIRGAKHHFDRFAVEHGTLAISDARVHWWLLAERDREKINNLRKTGSPGPCVAALYDGELYNLERGSEARSRYLRFGVLFEEVYSRLVIVIEANKLTGVKQVGGVRPNTSRSQLHYPDEPGGNLPWERWGREFKSKMPEPIRVACEAASRNVESSSDSVVERVKKYLSAMRSFAFRPDPNGRARVQATTDNLGRIVAPATEANQTSTTGGGGGAGTRKGSGTPLKPGTESAGGIRAKITKRTDVPLVEWVNWTDASMCHKAAEYVPGENKIHANKNFIVFASMADTYIRKYADIPGSDAEIKRLVREAFEIELVSKVMHAKALESRVGKTMFDKMTSPEALTMAVSGLVLVDHWLNAKIGGKYGKGKAADAT